MKSLLSITCNIADYVAAYPEGTPIVLYMGNTTKSDGEMYYTYLGSYPQYGLQ